MGGELSLTLYNPPPMVWRRRIFWRKDFLDGSPSAMVLGDNIFFGHGLRPLLEATAAQEGGATVFGYHVTDPERYGVVEFRR